MYAKQHQQQHQQLSDPLVLPSRICPRCGAWMPVTSTRLRSGGRWRVKYITCRRCGHNPHMKLCEPADMPLHRHLDPRTRRRAE